MFDWLITKIVVKKIKESAMWKFLEGKKTYLILATTIILGGLEAANIVIPGYVYAILGGLGLWTRAVAKPK
jgi:hypothetical protein